MMSQLEKMLLIIKLIFKDELSLMSSLRLLNIQSISLIKPEE